MLVAMLLELPSPPGLSPSSGHCLCAGQAATVPVMEAADALLAARLCAGDDDALAEIFDLHAAAAYAVAARVLGHSSPAQDVVQDVFVELWTHPDRYDPAVGSLRTYLVVLARNRAIDVGRSELRRSARQDRHHRMTPVEAPASPSQLAERAAAAQAVRQAVNALPAEQRAVVELAYFQGMTFREVALALGIPEGTAKSRLRLALAKLQYGLDRQLLEPT